MLHVVARRLTYANVMATIAVFVAIGGSAYAVSLAKNSVKSKQIAKNAVRAAEVKANAIGSAEVKSDAVGASEIAANGVGGEEIAGDAVGAGEIGSAQVGSGELADGAVGTSKIGDDSVGSAKIADGSVAAADLDGALGFNCPSGTRYFEGSCIETSNRSAAPFDSALADCIDEGRRLPDAGQLRGFGLRSDVALAASNEWAEPQYFDADTSGAALFRAPALGEGTSGGVDTSSVPHPYRCVASATG
jgi:hypothetical protein